MGPLKASLRVETHCEYWILFPYLFLFLFIWNFQQDRSFSIRKLARLGCTGIERTTETNERKCCANKITLRASDDPKTRMKTPLWLITDNWRILAWLIFQWFSPSKFGHDYYWLSINLSLRNEWFFIDFQIIYSLTFDWFNVKFSMLFYWLVFQCFFIDWFFNACIQWLFL